MSMLDVQPPSEGQQIARALGSRGGNLVEVNSSAACTQPEGLLKLCSPARHTQGILHAAKQTAGGCCYISWLCPCPLHGPPSAATWAAGDRCRIPLMLHIEQLTPRGNAGTRVN